MENEVREATLAVIALLAVTESSRGDKTTAGRTQRVRRAGRTDRNIKRLNRVVANISRQEVNETIRVSRRVDAVFVDPNRVLQVLQRHAHQLEIGGILDARTD